MHYEQDLLQRIMEARRPYGNSSRPKDLAKMDAQIKTIWFRFTPSWKIPGPCRQRDVFKLQARITQLEEAIADRREFYNHA
jgi:hypothetical protein